MDGRNSVVGYTKPSNTAGVVGTVLGGTALAGVAGNFIGGLFNRYVGGIANNIGSAPVVVAPASAPVVNAVTAADGCCGYVTKSESKLIREVASKDSEIAQLKAERYTDDKVQSAVDAVRNEYGMHIAALNNKVCELEKEAAVNGSRLHDYQHYANRIFVHQPTAKMNDCIVTTTNPCCCCSSAPASSESTPQI